MEKGEGKHLEFIRTNMKVTLIMWIQAYSEISFINKSLLSYITSCSPAKCSETPTKPLYFSHTTGSSTDSSTGEVHVSGRCGHPVQPMLQVMGRCSRLIPSTHTALGLGLKLSWKAWPPAVSWQQFSFPLPPKHFEIPRWKNSSSAKYFCL